MDVSSYVAPIIGGSCLMGLCWLLGSYQFSSIWIVLFVIMNLIKTKLWKQRQRRVIALQQTALREKEVVLAQLKDLPAWVQFPDTERVEWMNKVVFQLWPYIGEYCKKFIKEIVEPQVKAHMPSAFKSFRFEEIDVGDIPFRVGGVKVYHENVGNDKIVMDMDVAYAGDCEFVVAVGSFKAGLRQMQFKGKLRAILNPLLPKPPLIGGVSAFFLDVPTIDFDLTGLGEFVELPGLIGAVRSVINTQVASICVLPNEIVVPLSSETDVVKLYFPEPDGIVRLHVMDAKDLENADIILRGKSDPYTRLSVGGQNFQTKTIDNNLNPTWDEFFEAVVDQASGQKLIAEVYDDDPGSNDDFIGRMSLDMSVVKERGIVDEWYPLENVKHGDLHIVAYWYDLSLDPSVLATPHQLHYGQTRNKLNSAVLMLYVDNVTDLPSSKQNLDPSPFLEFTLGSEVQKTFPRPRTRHPLYRQKFIFFVSNVDLQTLKIEAKDDSTGGKPLGEFSLPLRNLLSDEHLERWQQTFNLALGPHVSRLTMTVRLRFLQLGIDEAKIKLNDAGAMTKEGKGADPKLTVPLQKSASSNVAAAAPAGRGTLRLRKFKLKGSTQLEGNLGRVHLVLSYDSDKSKFLVRVKCAENLISLSQNNNADPYVKVKLLKNGLVVDKRKTGYFKNTLNPKFEETFEFEVVNNEFHLYSLVLDIKDSSKSSLFRQTPTIGQVLYDLGRLKTSETNQWFDLQPPCYDNQLGGKEKSA